MDFKEQVTKLVENKVGDVINKDLEEKIIQENSSFDVETYVNILLDKHFSFNHVEQLKEIFNQDFYDDLIDSESECSAEERGSLQDSLEFDSNECHNFLEGEIIKNLENNSREIKKKSLKILEASAEDFINQTSWGLVMQSLHKTLTKTRDKEMCNLVLKIFQKVLKCSKKPQTICKGFTAVASMVSKQITSFNLGNESGPFEQTNDIKISKWQDKNNLEFDNLKHEIPTHSLGNVEVLIKLMWLLVDCQQQMPVKLARFSESRFREIIFSFVHLLSSTTLPENKKLSGLELLSVLNPTATWCSYYCHTATGRSLLCSALKKYKPFFIQVVEIILNHIKIKKYNRLPSMGDGVYLNKNSQKFKNDTTDILKPLMKIPSPGYETEKQYNRLKPKPKDERNNCIRSAPLEQTGTGASEDGRAKKKKNYSSGWLVKNIPRRIVNEAVFCHSVFFVTYLIQFRHGRALFPIQTTTRQRLLSIQDFSGFLTEYLENADYEWDRPGNAFTSNYKIKILETLDILKSVKCNMNSSRSVERQPFN